jgi:hypothetical protein
VEGVGSMFSLSSSDEVFKARRTRLRWDFCRMFLSEVSLASLQQPLNFHRYVINLETVLITKQDEGYTPVEDGYANLCWDYKRVQTRTACPATANTLVQKTASSPSETFTERDAAARGPIYQERI